MRYQFYREHKYVSSALNALERLIAKTDFRIPSQIDQVHQEFHLLAEMLEGHADYENSKLHELLKKRGSTIYEHVEDDHTQQEEQLANLQRHLSKTLEATTEKEQLESGYQFYLAYRKFVSDNLAHLHEEETVILPELQRLYSDDELRNVEFATYGLMTSEELIQMMEVLFPHMNPSDREAFLRDIKDSEPDKFSHAWQGIKSLLDSREQESLMRSLDIPLQT